MPFGEQPRHTATDSPDDSGSTLQISSLQQNTSGRWAIPGKVGTRVLTVGATSLLVVAVLVGLFLRTTGDPRGAIGTLLQIPTPTPEPTIAPSGNALYFANAVPWGTLTIDNKRMSAHDLIMHDFTGVTVSRGRHQLVYQARYFPTMRCTLSVPQASTDTCPFATGTEASTRGIAADGARTIDLGATSDHLATDQHDALVNAINAAAQAQKLSAAIAPGERYLDAQGNVATAYEPLTLTLTLTTNPAIRVGPQVQMGSCPPICSDTNGMLPGLSVDNLWHFNAILYAEWSVTDTSGKSIGVNDYPLSQSFMATNGATQESFTPIDAGLSASGWQVSGLDGLTTQEGVKAQENTITAAIGQAHSQPQSQGGGYAIGNMVMGIGSNPLQGCYVNISMPDSVAIVKMVARFGVAFVVDDSGQPYYTQMLHANADEAAVMTSLIQQGVTETPIH